MPVWDIINDIMAQVKHLAAENEKEKRERAYLIETLSLSQYTHTAADNDRRLVDLQSITPPKDKQAVAIEKNTPAKATTNEKQTSVKSTIKVREDLDEVQSSNKENENRGVRTKRILTFDATTKKTEKTLSPELAKI